MKRIEHILVPLDHSDLASDALDTALILGQSFGAKVLMLRISKDAASLERGEAEIDLNVIERETDELIAAAARRIGPTYGDDAKARVSAEVRSGPVVQIISEVVDEHHIDLIVMGTHGRKGIAEMFTGSTTEQIVATSPASVFVVKPEGFPYLRD